MAGIDTSTKTIDAGSVLINITTDGRWHDLKHLSEVPRSVLHQFTYEAADHYFKFQGVWYNAADFQPLSELKFTYREEMEESLPEWDGAMVWSLKEGALIKLDGERYKIAHYWLTFP